VGSGIAFKSTLVEESSYGEWLVLIVGKAAYGGTITKGGINPTETPGTVSCPNESGTDDSIGTAYLREVIDKVAAASSIP